MLIFLVPTVSIFCRFLGTSNENLSKHFKDFSVALWPNFHFASTFGICNSSSHTFQLLGSDTFGLCLSFTKTGFYARYSWKPTNEMIGRKRGMQLKFTAFNLISALEPSWHSFQVIQSGRLIFPASVQKPPHLQWTCCFRLYVKYHLVWVSIDIDVIEFTEQVSGAKKYISKLQKKT